jgi:xylan 1,4-beta-xylosidase
MEFEPRSYQHAAGLSAFYNAAHNHTLRLTYDPERGKALELLTTDQGLVSRPLGEVIHIDWSGALYLRCELSIDQVRFAYSRDGTEWLNAGSALSSHILTDEHTLGFTGVFFALRAHDLSGRCHPADFDWLDVN